MTLTIAITALLAIALLMLAAALWIADIGHDAGDEHSDGWGV